MTLCPLIFPSIPPPYLMCPPGVPFSVCVLLASVCQALPLAGWIQSPGFPNGYGWNVSKTWKYCAPPGHALSLTLLHLDLEESYECENDALKVEERKQLASCFLRTTLPCWAFDSFLLLFPPFILYFFSFLFLLVYSFSLFVFPSQISQDHHLLVNLCGRMSLEELQSSVNPSLHSSSGGCLSLTFHSDYSNTERHAGFRAFYTAKGNTPPPHTAPCILTFERESENI